MDNNKQIFKLDFEMGVQVHIAQVNDYAHIYTSAFLPNSRVLL